MSKIRCFLVEEIGLVKLSLRRYSSGSECSGHPYGYHNATVDLGEHPAQYQEYKGRQTLGLMPRPPKDDPRWPVKCDHCDYFFVDGDEWQINQEQIYVPAPGNDGPDDLPREEWRWVRHGLPAGAMYYPSWLQPGKSYDEPEGGTPGYCEPTDGTVLTVICPAWADWTGTAEWIVDSYCSNCSRRGERHHCWVRTGTPPWVTVGKDGDTCAAGAGSIWVNMSSPRGGWHGYLRDGWLVPA